jgi:predicted RNA-binding protein with PIN domain
VADPTLYLFDGHNLLHAGGFRHEQELVDRLADFLALQGARGIVVFDGPGTDRALGLLEIRHASDADSVLERLAAVRRRQERVCLVSSDAALRRASGQEVQKVSSQAFLPRLGPLRHEEGSSSPLAERLDAATREALERMRRGQA